MKKFIHKVQDLSQKAAQMKQAIQSAPGKAAEFREAMTVAAGQLHGQLHQLRADVQSSVNSLRTEGDDRLTHALRELDDDHAVFKQAGYVMHEVEMELGLAQRLVAHLEKVEDVPHSAIRTLLTTLDSRKTTHAIVAALLKAEELADKVNLRHLTYYKLTVYAGLTPSVRICWSVHEEELTHAPMAHAPPHLTSAPPPPPPPPPSLVSVAPTPSTSPFSQSSYFERAPATSSPAPAPAIVTGAPAAPAGLPASVKPTESHEPAPATGDFGRSALERFKKMPDLSKYRR